MKLKLKLLTLAGLILGLNMNTANAQTSTATTTVSVTFPSILVLYTYDNINLTLNASLLGSNLSSGSACTTTDALCLSAGADYTNTNVNATTVNANIGADGTVSGDDFSGTIDIDINNAFGMRSLGITNYTIAITETGTADAVIDLGTGAPTSATAAGITLVTETLPITLNLDQVTNATHSQDFQIQVTGT